MKTSGESLSAQDAARIIYNTQKPTPEQIGQVRLRLHRGHLKSGPGGPATTTAAAVAEFMAASSYARHMRHEGGQQLSGLYRELIQDYFVSVVSRRKLSHRGTSFHRAVLGGQVAALLLAVSVVVLIIRNSVLIEAPERKAVRQRIESQHDWYRIDGWQATQPAEEGPGLVVRVKFDYRAGGSRRIVTTERTFLVTGEQATELGGESDD